MIATLNFLPPKEWVDELEKNQIEISYVNLDPMVKTHCNVPGMSDSLSFEDGTIGFVCLAHVIEHLYHPMIALKEIYRVLRPSGKFLVSTDNAFMATALLNFMSCNGYLHEPVQGTAAMTFNDWRGHVRFYTQADLTTMLESVGFRVVDVSFREALYNALIEEYFTLPVKDIPGWKAKLLTEIPEYRSEILIVAEKKS